MPAPEPHSEIELRNEMQRFLQTAVHDLRAAQRRTGTAAELLLEAGDDNDRAALGQQLSEGLSKTEELLTAISKYATAVAPASYAMNVFSSAAAVRFALAHLEREIREAGAKISIGDLPEITGDRDRLAELFEHLIGNALKFRGAEPPVVEMGARRVAGGWQFSVKDNGIGIAPKYRDRLFVPFRRLHGAEVPGAGLGLAISQQIVAAHRGRIWIEDADGPGAIFSFILPGTDGD